MMSLVVDSGVLLKAYLPDEEGREEAQNLIKDYARGTVTLHAPSVPTITKSALNGNSREFYSMG